MDGVMGFGWGIVGCAIGDFGNGFGFDVTGVSNFICVYTFSKFLVWSLENDISTQILVLPLSLQCVV